MFGAWAARINDKRVILMMHRQILGLTDPAIQGDHRNGDGLDNRRQNLRACTKSQNGMNRPANKNNTTGYKGVTTHKVTGQFIAGISLNRKYYKIGQFDCPVKAAMAYDEAAKKLHGEFAKTNF